MENCLYVVKRDNTIQPFDKNKIINAISKAFDSTDGEVSAYALTKARNIADAIENRVANGEFCDIEEIQDAVEAGIMATKRKDVAKHYILYREERSKERNKSTAINNLIREKLMAKNVQNQNANLDEHSFGGRMGEANSAMMRQMALDELISEKVKYNHLNNKVYIHDLDWYYIGGHNCLSIPFDDLLANGFKTRQTEIRRAGSIATAFQLVAVIIQCQSLQQFGGVSATHLDWTMVPYVRKSFIKHYKDGLKWIENNDFDFAFDKKMSIEDNKYKHYEKAYKYAMEMLEKEIHQACEGMIHNLNSLQSRSGNQLPFSSVNFGTCTLKEGRMISKAVLECLIDGTGPLHRTSIFPCVIFKLKKGVNRKPEDPNYDLFQLALKSTAIRLYPNYANVDWSGNAGYDENDPRTEFSTMGCRTANGYDINGLGQLKDGRGNIAPSTIILPTLAMEAKEKSEETGENILKCFMEILDEAIDDCITGLRERFNWIASQSPKSAAFMYDNNTMAGYVPEEGIRSALKHGTLAVGQLGMAEALQILIGCDHTEPEGLEIAKEIEQLFKDKCAKAKETEKLNYGVYYSPAENLCYTAMKKFQKKYGKIKNVSDKDFFTNSIHVPVWKNMDPFSKIDIESQLTGYSSAGCITYIEIDTNAQHNIQALETIVNYAMDKDIPYFAINCPSDTCTDCGFTSLIVEDECPKCGGHNIERLRRVTGYITGNYTTAFNPGKQQEVEMRVKHLKGDV